MTPVMNYFNIDLIEEDLLNDIDNNNFSGKSSIMNKYHHRSNFPLFLTIKYNEHYEIQL